MENWVSPLPLNVPTNNHHSPGYGNSTAPVPYPTGTVPTTTGAAPTYPVESAPPIATAGAGKTVALSGAALAGVLGFAVLL